jgi:isopenicillin N synthase-like dioxygenase
MTRYYREMGKFSNGLLKLFAAALELDEDFFLSQADKPISRLRARHYPAHDARPLKGQLRAGAHTDYGDFTILLPDARVKGLQIKGRGGWRAAPAKDGAFLVNLGDLMARWTNDRWASTRHRVANEALGKARLTIAYFHYPNFDARVSCAPTCRGRRAKYPPVRAGEYLRRKLSVTIR